MPQPASGSRVPALAGVASPKPVFRGIQALRGIAALIVVAFHATGVWAEAVAGKASSLDWKNGAIGVDIFFVISGFVMAVSQSSRGSAIHPARIFLERRLIRIVPLFWIMSALLLLKELFRPWPGMIHPPPGYVVSSFLFLPYRYAGEIVTPLLAVGWTLQYEMFFYILFAVVLALRGDIWRWMAPSLVGLALAGFFIPASWPAYTSIANSLLLEFLGGLWLGRLILQGRRLSPRLAIGGALSLAIILFAPLRIPANQWRGLLWGPIAWLLVAAVLAGEEKFGNRWPRWLLLIGDASYSLYLSHLLVFPTAMKLVHLTLQRGQIRRMDELVMVTTSLLLCLAASLLLYFLVEKPLNNLLRSRFAGARALKHAVA